MDQPRLFPSSQETNLITSPLQAQVWQVLLQDHLDNSLVDYIIPGIQEGFYIGFNYPSILCHSAQCKTLSSREHPAVVSQYIASECHMKWMHGPFPSSYNIHTNPIGVIPKMFIGWFQSIPQIDRVLPFLYIQSAPSIFNFMAGILQWIIICVITCTSSDQIMPKQGCYTSHVLFFLHNNIIFTLFTFSTPAQLP